MDMQKEAIKVFNEEFPSSNISTNTFLLEQACTNLGYSIKDGPCSLDEAITGIAAITISSCALLDKFNLDLDEEVLKVIERIRKERLVK